MKSSIHTYQVKDYMDINGVNMFVWSISFIEINNNMKIKAKVLSGELIEINGQDT